MDQMKEGQLENVYDSKPFQVFTVWQENNTEYTRNLTNLWSVSQMHAVFWWFCGTNPILMQKLVVE